VTLDIGPGRNFQPHSDKPILRLDKRMDIQPHVVADARDIPFRSNTFSTVYASHILEHFRMDEAGWILKEWWRVVAPGGELQVFVPNLEWVAMQIMHGICDEFVTNALFGRQEYDLDVHRSGYTPDSLAALIRPLNPEYTIRTWRNSICLYARKPEWRLHQ